MRGPKESIDEGTPPSRVFYFLAMLFWLSRPYGGWGMRADFPLYTGRGNAYPPARPSLPLFFTCRQGSVP